MFNKLKVVYKSVFGSELDKYESRHIILSILSSKNGFRVGNKNLTWHKDEEFKKTYIKLKSHNKNHTQIPERKFVLYYIAKSIINIPGDIVECGVYIGESSYLMLKANQNTVKNLYGFDSFKGLSNPEKNDVIKNNYTFKWRKYDLSVSENRAIENLQEFKGRYYLLKGWIPDKFHELKNKTFSLIHIDVDLYQPTLDSLKFFWERLNIGGALICDDYGFETCPGARKAMDDFFNERDMQIIHLPTGQGVVFKQGS